MLLAEASGEQPLVGLGLVDRVEILALQVLDEHRFEHLDVGEVGPDDDRDAEQAGAKGGSEAAVAGDDDVAALVAADHEQGLQDASARMLATMSV